MERILKTRKIKTEEQTTKELENVKNIDAKKAAGEKLTFAERNILNINNRRNRTK